MWYRCQLVKLGFVFALLVCWCANVVKAAENESTLNTMPVREVTIFKDGHAFVHHEGKVKTDKNGNVNLDYLPSPVLGTFWSYSADDKVKLKSVTAGKQRFTLKHTALSLIDLIKANIGAEAIIQEQSQSNKEQPLSYHATLLSIPTRSAKEVEAASPFAAGPHLPLQGSTILLKTEQGIKAININTIRNITFLKKSNSELEYNEIRTRLRLNLDWGDAKPAAQAHVGMTYLQRGIRWIPHYSLTVNDDGTVLVQLQATLINELTDLDNVTANLLVGVPKIDFKNTTDPIAMQQQGVQLSSYFANAAPNSSGRSMLSNSIMTQTQMVMPRNANPFGRQPAAVNPLGPKLTNTDKNGAMFTFILKNITLAKGERMVVPVGEWTMKYETVYKLHIPVTPPAGVLNNIRSQESAKLAQMLFAPKVKETLRITNAQQAPFTTAPVLIKSSKGLLGQGMMTYTASGNTVDITITTAINVSVHHHENETKRQRNAVMINGNQYSRINLKGEVQLTNFNKKDIKLEVSRMTMGKVDSAGEKGRVSRPAAWAGSTTNIDYYRRYNWYDYWLRANSRSEISWSIKLKAGETIKLPYEWHYFWR